MTDKQLKSLCELWQKRLRLQDWDIVVRLVDSDDINDALGQTRVTLHDKVAVIRLKKPEALDPTNEEMKAFPERFDLEYTLIHELVHVPLDGLITEDAEEHESAAQEQAINQIARALYEAYIQKGG